MMIWPLIGCGHKNESFNLVYILNCFRCGTGMYILFTVHFKVIGLINFESMVF